jgi:hypothetical protein
VSTLSSSSPSVAALRPQWRAVRVAVLGATSLLLATSAHAVGGGDLPALGVLAVTAIVLGLVAVPLTARRCRTGVLLAVLGVQQTLLHLLFGCCGPSRLRPQRPRDGRSPAWCRVCHARHGADECAKHGADERAKHRADGRRRDHELDDDRCPHRSNHRHRLAARARRGVVVAHC